jgi:hypothetical protein
MKKLLLIIAILAVAALAIASPFITADPQSATKYQMRLSADNGATWSAWVQGDPVSGAMKFDIGTTPAGSYKGEAQAGGNVSVTDTTTGQVSTVFKWSASAPFSLTVVPGQTIIKIRIIE